MYRNDFVFHSNAFLFFKCMLSPVVIPVRHAAYYGFFDTIDDEKCQPD